jgi:hypothetical protein
MEGNIRIYRLPKGRGTDQWKMILPEPKLLSIHGYWTGLYQHPSMYHGIVKVTWRMFNQLDSGKIYQHT